MATRITMPKLSDTMEEGVILKWLRKEGEKVKQGEVLVEIESDKADMELEAYDTGVLRKIVVPEGGKAPIGALIGVIGEPSEDISALLSPAAASKRAVPETQKAPIAASKQAAPPTPQPGASARPSLSPPSRPTDGRTKASPLARRLASENNIDLARISGSGPQGRVIKRDIEGALMSGVGTTARTTHPIVPGTSADVELSLIRKTIAKRMTESKQTAPHFYVTVEIEMEPAMAFRDQINNVTQIKLSFTDIIIKAAAAALMQHPQVNASYLGDKTRQYHYAHIGVAVALEDGLVTPIVRNCEQKSILQINEELRDLAERARTRKLKPEEYTGGTFTISNLGMYGVEEFVAIINPPEGAILAVGTIVEKAVVKGGQVAVGHAMKATLSADHRIIDGVIAARFLQDFKTILENPAALVL
jgi:pyruvate dehydrogenase E2 component (dihydrolipoamide acetyltransferase)